MIAHINPDTGERQTVIEHCINTALRAEKLGEGIGLGNIGYLIGLTHDIGKMRECFREYIEKAYIDKNSVRRGELNHSSAGGIFIFERYSYRSEMHHLTSELIMNAVMSHHGLYDIFTPEGKDILSIKLSKKDEIGYREVSERFLKAFSLDEIDTRFERAIIEIEYVVSIIQGLFSHYSDKKDIQIAQKFYFGCLQRLLSSLVIDADRIDTAVFCGSRGALEEKHLKYYYELWSELASQLEEKLSKFPKADGIFQCRRKISEDCLEFSKKAKGIYQLMVPTGGGKTLASLRFAISHALKYDMKHVYYVAPYMSILDQNADVIKKVFQRGDIILEHHSNVINENEEVSDEWRLLTENWDSPIILTTMVQLLNTLFDARTQCIRRMHNLSNSVIIFDEIQSIPAKCIHTFNIAVNFLSYVCNSTVILCSATQPPLDSKVQHRILLGNPNSIIQNKEELYRKFKRVEVRDKTILGGYNTELLSAMVSEIIDEVNNVLVIMNTKNAALKLFYSINDKCEISSDKDKLRIIYLSTNMCPKHRLELIHEIRERLNRKEKLICISTSLIEAGVDISFCHVIRSLAGLDSIAQAAGRCNRNGEQELGVVTIINSSEEDISKLPEIKNAQIATDPILRKYSTDPEYFSTDLLAPLALEKFYNFYFKEMQGEMNYRVKDKNTNLLDLLSQNATGVKAYYTNTREMPNMILTQAFKTAGEEFEVIANNTTTIIVPHNSEAVEIINILNGDSTIEEMKIALKKVQAYSVNLYQQEFERLFKMGGIKLLLHCGIYTLIDGYYSEKIGVTSDANMDFLLI